MNTRTLTIPAMICNFVLALREANFSLESPICASSRDHGFDFDEEELGKELLAPLPAAPASPIIPEADADEFEKVFRYFLS